jgi:hypothetical protein
MGSRLPPANTEPVIVEDHTAPQIYVDGAVVRIGPETCHTICYRAFTSGGQTTLHEVARIIQSRSSFDWHLTRAWLVATGPMEQDGEKRGGRQ